MQSVWKYPYALLGIVFILIGIALLPRHRPIPVLIYHGITTSTLPQDSYTVETALLSQEFDYLNAHGYTPLTFAAIQTLTENNKLPEHPVVITFDDALASQFSQALPLLQMKTVPASFFITSDLVGTPGYLTWDQVRAIAAAGMEIGGHSKTHAHLLQLSEQQQTEQVAGDKTNIERELGKPLSVFAYPFQERDAATDAVVKNAGYTIVRDTPAYRSTVMTNSFTAFLKSL